MTRPRTGRFDGSLGWLPPLGLLGGIGLLLVALAMNEGRAGGAAAEPLFWIGLGVLVVPAWVRLACAATPREERVGVLVGLGMGLYLVKVLHSPFSFTFYDELLHLRTVADIGRTGQLFGENSLLPVSPYYPGLEIATVALAGLGGVSSFVAGLAVVAAARLLLVLALFLACEQIGGSARVAGLATFLYMANPSFVFFGAQFAYESLSLPLAALVVWAAARRGSAAEGRVGLTLVVLLSLAAVVITHHVTSYVLATLLSLWGLLAVATASRAEREPGPGPSGLALLALVAALGWLVYVATLVVGYLGPNVAAGLSELGRLLAGEMSVRELFRTSPGQLAPLWDRLTGFGAVGLILLGMPFGLVQVWRHQRTNALALTLATAALAYPATLAMRLTDRGAIPSGRSWEFLFVGIGFVLALGLVGGWLDRGRPLARSVVAALAAAIVFAGGVTVGWPYWARLPGPYLVAADTRSIEAQGIAAAYWSRDHLGPRNRIAADRINGALMGAYGEQHLVSDHGDGVAVAEVFFAADLGPPERALLRQGRVRYVVVDRRLSTALPLVVYFEQGEHGSQPHSVPLDPTWLAKFDRAPGVSRVFDSGDIAIYDVGAAVDGS